MLNPSDGTVLGKVADAGQDDVLDAIAAARRAFEEKGELRDELIAEAGTPHMPTYGAQLEEPLEKFRCHIEHIDQFEWVRGSPTQSADSPTSRLSDGW